MKEDVEDFVDSEDSEDFQETVPTEPVKDIPENVRKFNEELGITERENLFNSAGISQITAMLEDSKRDFEILCKEIAEKKEAADGAEKNADAQLTEIKALAKSVDPSQSLKMMDESRSVSNQFALIVAQMQDLIQKGNGMIGKIYDAVVNTDIIDPDLLAAASNMIHCIRESNDNLIQFATQKMAIEAQFRQAIETEKQKQQHRLELEYFKWTLRQKELENKARIKAEQDKANAIDVPQQTGNGRSWSAKSMHELLRSEVVEAELVEPEKSN